MPIIESDVARVVMADGWYWVKEDFPLPPESVVTYRDEARGLVALQFVLPSVDGVYYTDPWQYGSFIGVKRVQP